MTRFWKRLLPSMALATMVASPQAIAAQSQRLDARVVILDASGSMRRNSYPQNEGTRWNEAMALAEEYFDQLEDLGDTVPTEVLIFGAETNFVETLRREQRKPAAQREFNNSAEYPQTGPLCKDIKSVTGGFAAPTTGTFDRLKSYISGLPNGTPGGGMTPQGSAINMALESIIAEHGKGGRYQIAAFSDFEDINCAPPDQTVCEQILPNLNFLADAGGSVEIRILEIPSSNLVFDVLDCVPAKTDSHDPGGDTPQKTIKDFLDTVSVTAKVTSTTPGLLNAGTIDLIGMTFQAYPANSRTLASGGPAQSSLPLSKGLYDFVLTDGQNTWRTKRDVQTDADIVFSIEAGRIELTATANGQPLNQLDALEIIDASGRNLLPGGAAQLNRDFVLMAGTYTVKGSARGMTQTVPVNVRFDDTTTAALDFSRAAAGTTPRSVAIELDVRQPTLDLLPYSPSVVLVDSSGVTKPLTQRQSAVSLDPGNYGITVEGARRHILSFVVPSGVQPVDVRVVVTPGWFEAQAPVAGGSFELQDASGRALAALTGDAVRQSISDGSYILVHIGPDGQRREARMEITTGDFTEVRF